MKGWTFLTEKEKKKGQESYLKTKDNFLIE